MSEAEPGNGKSRDRLAIFGGRSHPEFVAAVCAQLGHPVAKARLRTFVEETIEVKLEENVRGRDVFVVQSGQANPNDHLVELLFLIDAARLASARSVTAVMPYFLYSQGDKKDEPRVSIRGRVVADSLQAAGAQRVLTMDLPSPQMQGFFHVPVDNLYALPVFAAEIEQLVMNGAVERPVIVAPDAGAAKRARGLQERLDGVGAGIALGDKVRRHHDERSEVTALLGDVKDRDCIIVDDVTFTGGTLCNLAERLMQEGARSVRTVVTHALLAGDAVSRIEASPFAEVIVTDTVPLPANARECDRVRVVSVAPLFAEAIRSIFEETSISRLFG